MIDSAPRNVWIVGIHREQTETGIVWEFGGVFLEESAAIDACRESNYFIGPAALNHAEPHEPVDWEGCYYPKA